MIWEIGKLFSSTAVSVNSRNIHRLSLPYDIRLALLPRL